MNIREKIVEIDEDILLLDNFDLAIIGIYKKPYEPIVAVYDKEKCIKIIMEKYSLNYHLATEYFNFNILEACFNSESPLFITLLD